VRRRLFAAAAALALAVVPAVPGRAVQRVERHYGVRNLGGIRVHTLHGFEVTPPCGADTVILLLHGLSYTSEAWDFPGYSYARILAERGYAVVAIDRLGYGDSRLANGREVSTVGHADMAAQVAEHLSRRFEHVVLAGHSAGAEAAVSAVGFFGAPVDALIPMAYHTFPGVAFAVNDWVAGDQRRALFDDYEYFMGTPERRAAMFYTGGADPAVVAADNASAVLTPSGEIQTISFQPSRIGSLLVQVPVLAQLAESDRLFPSNFANQWAAQFVSAPSVTVDIVPGTGHTYMLHHAGPAAAHRIADWLGATAGLPGC
jgi:pimeloyl-ACP methyl ester carboxylesterase